MEARRGRVSVQLADAPVVERPQRRGFKGPRRRCARVGSFRSAQGAEGACGSAYCRLVYKQSGSWVLRFHFPEGKVARGSEDFARALRSKLSARGSVLDATSSIESERVRFFFAAKRSRLHPLLPDCVQRLAVEPAKPRRRLVSCCE